jgi:very-short-patch-repair endonuclease
MSKILEKLYGKRDEQVHVKRKHHMMFEGMYQRWPNKYNGFTRGIRHADEEPPTHGPVKVIYSRDADPVVYEPTPIGMRASELRQIQPTAAEIRMRNGLEYFKSRGFSFGYSVPFGDKFVLDFFCPKAKLAVEVDGGYHNTTEQQNRDNARTKYLNACGVHVLRFTNEQVRRQMNEVLREIGDAVGVEYESGL